MAPCSVSTPAKGVPVGRLGITPDLTVESLTNGGGGASVTFCAVARAETPRRRREDLCIMETILSYLIALEKESF